jgi:hypothetical protein
MSITKKNKSGILALAFAAASVSSAFGYTVTLSQGSYQSGTGGEFKATDNNNALGAYISSYAATTASGNSFQTFCIEKAETFNYGTAHAAAISGAAIHGGVPNGSDPVAVGTGWLYSQFAQGLLTDYLGNNYFSTGSRSTNAGELQKAIWWLEGEITTNQSNNKYIKAAATALGVGSTVPTSSPGAGGSGLAADSLNGHNAAWYGVYALNMGPFDGNPNVTSQDQLIYKSTGNQVPDGGATLLLLGLSLTGMGALQRRMRRTA